MVSYLSSAVGNIAYVLDKNTVEIHQLWNRSITGHSVCHYLYCLSHKRLRRVLFKSQWSCFSLCLLIVPEITKPFKFCRDLPASSLSLFATVSILSFINSKVNFEKLLKKKKFCLVVSQKPISTVSLFFFFFASPHCIFFLFFFPPLHFHLSFSHYFILFCRNRIFLHTTNNIILPSTIFL